MDDSDYPKTREELTARLAQVGRLIDEQQGVVKSRYVQKFLDNLDNPSHQEAVVVAYFSELFDAYGQHMLWVVRTEESLNYYRELIGNASKAILVDVDGVTGSFHRTVAGTLPQVIELALAGRIGHWQSQALKQLREIRDTPNKPATNPMATRVPSDLVAVIATPKNPRRYLEPNPQLLAKGDTLNRLQAAEALGVTPRTLDRWIVDEKLIPVGSGGRKRFKTRDLKKFLNAKSSDYQD